MNRPFLLPLFVLLGACAAPAPAPAGASSTPAPTAAVASVRTVDVTTLKADLDRGAVPLLIDVRTPGEFEGGHVAGAKNVPLSEIEARMGEFGSPDAEVYVICQSGGRSAKASDTLAGKGFHPVNVAGGTGAWVSAGYPVAR